jgi:hypothetical protein
VSKQRITAAWVHRDLRDTFRAAVAAGWKIFRHGGTHLKWVSPDGTKCVHSSGKNISSPRVVLNIREDLRANGLKFEED